MTDWRARALSKLFTTGLWLILATAMSLIGARSLNASFERYAGPLTLDATIVINSISSALLDATLLLIASAVVCNVLGLALTVSLHRTPADTSAEDIRSAIDALALAATEARSLDTRRADIDQRIADLKTLAAVTAPQLGAIERSFGPSAHRLWIFGVVSFVVTTGLAIWGLVLAFH